MCCMVVLVYWFMMMVLEDGKRIGVGAGKSRFPRMRRWARRVIQLGDRIQMFLFHSTRASCAMAAAADLRIWPCTIHKWIRRAVAMASRCIVFVILFGMRLVPTLAFDMRCAGPS